MSRKKGPVNDAERAQRQLAAMSPRNRKPAKELVEATAVQFGETMDEASLRLQIARANTEQLDEAKRRLELDKARGLLVSKQEAIDLAQSCLLRAAQVFDLIPERLRDRLDPAGHHVCDLLDDIIREARTEVANIE